MASECVSRSDPVRKGFSIPNLFMMAIENAREQRRSRARFVVEFLRVQDQLELACVPCRTLLPLNIFNVADAEQFFELSRSGRVDEVRDEITDRYGEYIATCPRCLKRSLLPLWLPPVSLGVQSDDGGDDDGNAAGKAA
jgi:hypothetical protein